MTSSENKLRKELGLEVSGCGCKNYSVKAGAGGGKTTLLSRRITNQIIQGTPIEEFVIITYTNAAATELREKITTRLQEVIFSGSLKDEKLKRAKNALNSIELMQISTIHAFLFKILKEHAFESGIVMDARMLEDEEADRKKKFFDRWYHDHFDEIEAYRDDWIHESENGKKSEHHREVFENMFNDISDVRENIVFDVADHTGDFDNYARGYVRTWLGALINFKTEFLRNIPLNKNGTPKKINKEPQEIIDNISAVQGATVYGINEALSISDALTTMYGMLKKDKPFYGASNPNTPLLGVIPTYPEMELEWSFRKLYEEYFSKAQKASKVAEYVCRIQKAYQVETDAETLVLSNDDILYRAEKLLLEHKDILEKLRDRYSKIYVDEFQDTTDLQTRIIKLLSEKKGSDLAEIELKEDKLLVVGDSKQSIYRFTGAEKSVYDDVDRMMDTLPNAVAESAYLESNFRSNTDIVTWVNNSFDGSAAGISNGLMTDYTAMSTDWVVTETNALHGVYKYGNLENTCKKEEDVANVVNLVKTLVNSPQCFLERVSRNKDGGFEPPELTEIQYSDIMIICRNTTNMSSYVEAFSAEGIPVNVQGKFKIAGDEVLRNFVLLVEYFANYKNKKNRITAAQIIHGFDVTKVDNSILINAENELYDLRKKFQSDGLDVAGILQNLLSHENLYIPKDKVNSIERVRSYRIRLHQMIEMCLGKNSGDLSELVRIMRDYLDSDVKREIPLESNENAIRLMNAHQSKGLTGQIVIIADRSAGEGCRYSGFRKGGNYYPAATFKYNDKGASNSVIIPTYGYDMAMLKQVYREETEEAIRLQYVAATRAAHALVIMPIASPRNTPWFSNKAFELETKPDILEWIDGRKQDTAVYPIVPKSKSSAHTIIKMDDLVSNLATTSIDCLSENQIISITPSGLERTGVTGYDVKDSRYVKESRPSADAFGTVMHRVYELIFNRYDIISNISANDQEKAIDRIINQAILEQTDNMRTADKPEEFFEYLRSIMLKYLSKVILPIIIEADKIYPEYSFSFYISDSEKAQFITDFAKYLKDGKLELSHENEMIWVNGQADLVVKRKDGSIKVFDYKSDAMNGKPLLDFEKSLADKYEGQLALYKYAIGKAFGVTNVETELIHLYK